MTYKTLMVHVDDSQDSVARIGVACALADQMGAVLIGVGSSMPISATANPIDTQTRTAERSALERDVAEIVINQASLLFRNATRASNVEKEWRSALAPAGQTVAREARIADLIVVGPDSDKTTTIAAEVMMTAGRPVLFVPSGVERSPLGTGVIIAWNNSREARRALTDALPLLRRARHVSVVHIHDPDETRTARDSTEDVVAYLGHHRIHAVADPRPANDTTPMAGQILAAAHDMHASLIVLGGYGHGSLREWAFGSVTCDIMATSQICLLMSH